MKPDLPLIIDCATLQPLLNAPSLVLLDICRPELYPRAHLPGALSVSPGETQAGMLPAPGALPDAARLQAFATKIGLQTDSQVVVYDDEGGGWAGRLIWLLYSIGFTRCSLLDGGILAWHDEGYPLSNDPVPYPRNGRWQVAMDPSHTITRDALQAALGQEDIGIWDARSAMEYQGISQSAARNGHIPGAVHYEWTQVMDTQRQLRLRPLEEIRRELATLGLTERARVVTHCQSHHRSGLTWLVGRALSLPIQAYAGSWYEWGNHPDTPIEI